MKRSTIRVLEPCDKGPQTLNSYWGGTTVVVEEWTGDDEDGMATIQTRPYSGDYSGLISQAVIASVFLGFTVTAFELMRRKRRKIPSQKNEHGVLGSVDSWEFG